MSEPTLAEVLRLLDEIEAQVRVVRELVALAADQFQQATGEGDSDA